MKPRKVVFSSGAFLFFTIAWVFSLIENRPDSITLVGLMWLSLAIAVDH